MYYKTRLINEEAALLLRGTVCLYYSDLYYINSTEVRASAALSVQRLDTGQKTKVRFSTTAEIPLLATTFWPTVRSTKCQEPQAICWEENRPGRVANNRPRYRSLKERDGLRAEVQTLLSIKSGISCLTWENVIYFERSKIKDSQNMRDEQRVSI